MLKSLIFENFKSFGKTQLDIERLTTIIGSNASGKTNAIEGIKILSEIATGRDLSVILDGSKNVDSEIRGGSAGCPRTGSDTFTLGCIVGINEDYDLEYKITIKVANRVYVHSESLYKVYAVGKILIFQTKETPDDYSDISVEYNNGKKGRNPEIYCMRAVSILTQLLSKMPGTTERLRDNIDCINLVVNRLSNILFLNPLPSNMRDYARKGDHELKPNAENISSVLYDLCKKQDKESEILSVIRTLTENEIVDIDFIETTIGDVMLKLGEKFGDHSEYVEAKRLSDGTLRYLAIVTSMISEKPGSMVIIEEVDNGIHPSRIKSLISTITTLSQRKQIDVVITTHNPTLLNALSKEDMLGVVLCYREQHDGSSQFFSLPDLESLPMLLSKGKLGDLTVSNDLINAVKNPVQQNNDLDWLGV